MNTTVQDINSTLSSQLLDHHPEEAEWIQLQVQDDLKYVHDLNKYLTEVILSKKYGWNHKDFHQFKVKQEAFNSFLSTPVYVEEGVLQCTKCKSKRIYTSSKQTRAGDEATSVFAKCTECFVQWQAN